MCEELGEGAQNVLEFRDTSLLVRGTNHLKLRGTNLPFGMAGIQSLLDFWSHMLHPLRDIYPQMSPPKGMKEHHSII